MEWLNDIFKALTSGLNTVGTAILEFIKNGVVTLFCEVGDGGTVTGVSTFGILVFVFIGVSLALSLTYFVVNFIRHRG